MKMMTSLPQKTAEHEHHPCLLNERGVAIGLFLQGPLVVSDIVPVHVYSLGAPIIFVHVWDCWSITTERLIGVFFASAFFRLLFGKGCARQVRFDQVQVWQA